MFPFLPIDSRKNKTKKHQHQIPMINSGMCILLLVSFCFGDLHTRRTSRITVKKRWKHIQTSMRSTAKLWRPHYACGGSNATSAVMKTTKLRFPANGVVCPGVPNLEQWNSTGSVPSSVATTLSHNGSQSHVPERGLQPFTRINGDALSPRTPSQRTVGNCAGRIIGHGGQLHRVEDDGLPPLLASQLPHVVRRLYRMMGRPSLDELRQVCHSRASSSSPLSSNDRSPVSPTQVQVPRGEATTSSCDTLQNPEDEGKAAPGPSGLSRRERRRLERLRRRCESDSTSFESPSDSSSSVTHSSSATPSPSPTHCQLNNGHVMYERVASLVACAVLSAPSSRGHSSAWCADDSAAVTWSVESTGVNHTLHQAVNQIPHGASGSPTSGVFDSAPGHTSAASSPSCLKSVQRSGSLSMGLLRGCAEQNAVGAFAAQGQPYAAIDAVVVTGHRVDVATGADLTEPLRKIGAPSSTTADSSGNRRARSVDNVGTSATDMEAQSHNAVPSQCQCSSTDCGSLPELLQSEANERRSNDNRAAPNISNHSDDNANKDTSSTSPSLNASSEREHDQIYRRHVSSSLSGPLLPCDACLRMLVAVAAQRFRARSTIHRPLIAAIEGNPLSPHPAVTDDNRLSPLCIVVVSHGFPHPSSVEFDALRRREEARLRDVTNTFERKNGAVAAADRQEWIKLVLVSDDGELPIRA